jgi:hypothetical protein
MTETLTGDAVWPPYARVIDSPGGRFKRWCLHTYLRFTAKHQLMIDADVAKLRTKQETVDRQFGKIEPDVRQAAADATAFRAEWIDVPGSQPGRVSWEDGCSRSSTTP